MRVPEFDYCKYQRYLMSPVWAEKRAKRLKKDGHKCFMCKTEKRLKVHHLHYDTLYSESNKCLVTLCTDCHDKAHQEATKHLLLEALDPRIVEDLQRRGDLHKAKKVVKFKATFKGDVEPANEAEVKAIMKVAWKKKRYVL